MRKHSFRRSSFQTSSRYLWLLVSRKRRDMFLDRLNHQLDYDPAFAVRVPPAHQTVERIEALLRKCGAPSENSASRSVGEPAASFSNLLFRHRYAVLLSS